jgi:hypothetical protein
MRLRRGRHLDGAALVSAQRQRLICFAAEVKRPAEGLNIYSACFAAPRRDPHSSHSAERRVTRLAVG